MADKQQRLHHTVHALQARYSVRAARFGREAGREWTPGLSTGFRSLDAITGFAGLPLNAISLLSGASTSGKQTLAYQCLRLAQAAFPRRPLVAVFDLARAADPDYIARCGVDLTHLLIIRPPSPEEALAALADALRGRQLRAVLVDGLPELMAGPAARLTATALPGLAALLDRSACALIFLDEPRAPWQRWLAGPERDAARQSAALQIDLRREAWLDYDDHLRGYRAQARIARSRLGRPGASAAIEILFNGAVRARETW